MGLHKNISGYRAEHALVSRLLGLPVADAVTMPFSKDDKKKFYQLLASSSAKNIDLETHSGIARFPNIATTMNAELRGWLPVMGVDLDEEIVAKILADAENELSQFVINGGEVEFEITAHIASFTQ